MTPTDTADEERELPIFVMTDQPTDCPRCQYRTPYVDIEDGPHAGKQHHTCTHCGFEFLIAQDFDGEEQCERDECRDFAPVEDLEANRGVCGPCKDAGWRWSDEHDDYVQAMPDDPDDPDDQP